MHDSPRWVLRAAAALIGLGTLLMPFLAYGQGSTVYQNGTVVPEHLAKFFTNGRIGDVGGILGDVNGNGVSPFAILDRHGPGVCSYTASTLGPYAGVCLGHDAANNALITVESVGQAPAGLHVLLNGSTYSFPGAGNGNVVGPSPTSIGSVALWNSLDGTALKNGAGGTLSGTSLTGFLDYANLSVVDTSTNTDAHGVSGGPKTNGLRVTHSFGSGEGNRNAIFSILEQTAATPLIAGTSFYTSNFAWTKVTVPTPNGNYYAYGGLTEVFSGGPVNVKAAEFDTSLHSPATSNYHVTMTLDLVNSHASRGVFFDAAMSIGRDSSTTATYQNGIVFGDPLGYWPFASDSTLINVNPTHLSGSPPITASYGIDFFPVTFTNGAFRAKGFSVDPLGATTINPQTSGAVAALLVKGGTGTAATNGGMIAMTNTGTTSPTPTKWLRVDNSGTFQILNSDYTKALLAVNDGGAWVMTTKVAGGNAPGIAAGQLELVCGTTAGKAKLIISAGTSTTPVTIIDNIGAGVAGC